ncbi:hypothetical protein BDP55DRAFT_724926 [Colletotrichum godetiae]|uniref:Uncharacterized protein n=1 Tax=Colletotrichum godetiae TaxID=1209918 RepID=A0AAJ0AWN1_9PEZI|nr:uncharacterized protein BDP55DRAFT_724926 [Colletotrichum godetiae]KAK1690376.1 hypothetical protein BDP55DRAFT_724926 [Colletotrichum godetiae]
MSRNLYDPPFHYRPRRPYVARYPPPSALEIEAYLASFSHVHDRASSPMMSPPSSGRHREEDHEARERGVWRREASGGETEHVPRAVGSLSLVHQAPRDPEALARSRRYRLIQIRLLLVQVYDQLKIAHEVYNTAFEKFLKQVAETSKSASPATQNYIWVDMLSTDAEKGKKEATKKRLPPPIDFDTVMAQVETCLQSLEGAQMKYSPLASSFDDTCPNAEGHFKVVIDAVREIVNLAAKALKENLVCEDLVARLDRARGLADTTSHVWKAVLWKLPSRGIRSKESDIGRVDHAQDSNNNGEGGQNNEQSGCENVS